MLELLLITCQVATKTGLFPGAWQMLRETLNKDSEASCSRNKIRLDILQICHIMLEIPNSQIYLHVDVNASCHWVEVGEQNLNWCQRYPVDSGLNTRTTWCTYRIVDSRAHHIR